MVNAALVLFGLWCYVARVRSARSTARAFAWFWTLLEFGNGTGHTLLALIQGGYFPGVGTAPILLGASLYLAIALSGTMQPPPAAADS